MSERSIAERSQVVEAPRYALMFGTSPDVKGGIASVVTTLRAGGFFEQTRVRYVSTYLGRGNIDKVLQFLRAIVETFFALYGGKAALADYVTIGECCRVLRGVFGEYRPGEAA